MTVGELEFEQGDYEFDLPELGRLTLRCPKKKDVDLNVIVGAFEKEMHLPEFARDLPPTKGKQMRPYIAHIQYAFGSLRCPVAALAGARSVAVVNFRNQSFDSFQLFKGPNEDEGFWNLEMFFTKEGLVVLYESGVALIDNAGKLAWHERITWNDRMFERDDEKLRFYADFGEGFDWSIRLRDGVTSGKKPPV